MYCFDYQPQELLPLTTLEKTYSLWYIGPSRQLGITCTLVTFTTYTTTYLFSFQDDMLSGTLTVRENIALSAALRLPRDISRGERSEKVDEIIEELNLSHVTKSKASHTCSKYSGYLKISQIKIIAPPQIGNQFIRGVSGGQRKRTSIAMEMIVSPAILFLDEPTTGLDATTALSVIRLLYKWVNLVLLLVMILHIV